MGMVHLSVEIELSGDGGPNEGRDLERAEATIASMPEVLQAIAGERCRQDILWGGFVHDDGHSAWDWEGFIVDQACRLTTGAGPQPDYRQRLIKVAALAVAAAQAWDRQHAPGESGEHLQPTPEEG